jgi:hypothetical protein
MTTTTISFVVLQKLYMFTSFKLLMCIDDGKMVTYPSLSFFLPSQGVRPKSKMDYLKGNKGCIAWD